MNSSSAILAGAALAAMLATTSQAAVVDMLGDQDFADGDAISSGAVTGAAGGDPAPFNVISGNDGGGTFGTISYSHTFALGGASPVSAILRLGLLDHDSSIASEPGVSIMFDGIVQDVSMWAGISSLPARGYIRDMAVDVALLADGMLDVSIMGLAVSGQSGNAIAADFSKLTIDVAAVPVPAGGLLLLTGLGALALRRRNTRG